MDVSHILHLYKYRYTNYSKKELSLLAIFRLDEKKIKYSIIKNIFAYEKNNLSGNTLGRRKNIY